MVTRVMSGWERASRSMRTKYHICQQFAVEFGRVSVDSDALLGKASRDYHLFAGSKTIPGWWIIQGQFRQQSRANGSPVIPQVLSGITYIRLDGDNLDISGIFRLREVAKKKVRHTFANLESQNQVYFGYGVKSRRIGSSNNYPPSLPHTKGRKKSEKKHKRREERARTH